MTVEQAIRTALASVAGGRVYNGPAPEDVELPYVGFIRTGESPQFDMAGTRMGGISQYRFQFDTVADDLDVARAVAVALESALLASSALDAIPLNSFESVEDEPTSAVFVQEFSIWHTP